MRNLGTYLRVLLSIGLLLILITVGRSYFEYRYSKNAVLSLFENQAAGIIRSVAAAGEKGLIAYQSLQDLAAQRLYTIAENVDAYYREGLLTSDRLDAIILSNDLDMIMILDSSANVVRKSLNRRGARSDSVQIDQRTRSFARGRGGRMEPGFIEAVSGPGKTFVVASRDYRGGAILVGVNVRGLQSLSKTFGAGSIIEDISQNPNVRYAAILFNDLVMAATKSFPVDMMDDWYAGPEIERDSVLTRIHHMADPEGDRETIFEAVGPFYVAGQYYGRIVVGLESRYLNLLTSKLKRDVIWHSVLGLLITLFAVAGVVVWNNLKLMSSKYEEIKSEVQKLEADKAVKARLASMGELAGGVAHEIRNPLNAIKVIVQRLRREFTPEDDKDEYYELTDVVTRETDKINETVRQFLKMARPPALNKTRGNLNDCIENVLGLFQPRAEEKNIGIDRQLGRIPDISLDSELCGQAILNILENSLDAAADKGTITIRSFRNSDRIIIEIEDDGAGVPDDLKPRIFDMYFTTKDTGTGMGLPSVLMTVKEHGGNIEVHDGHSGGAVFRMEFPVEQQS